MAASAFCPRPIPRLTDRDSEIIEEALRRDLGLELLDRIWATADMDEDEAMRLAVEAQHESRRARRA